MILKSYPYLLFPGCCHAALESYSQIFQGQILELKRVDELRFPLPPDVGMRVFHAVFQAEGLYFMACDIFPGHQVSLGTAISLVVDFADVERAQRCYDLLRQGGKIVMPFSDTPRSLGYGKVCDAYGIYWDLNAPRLQGETIAEN